MNPPAGKILMGALNNTPDLKILVPDFSGQLKHSVLTTSA
jgi:hypothetical protein